MKMRMLKLFMLTFLIMSTCTSVVAYGSDSNAGEENNTPTYDLFDEPCLDFGCTKDYIKSYMSGYVVYKEFEDSDQGEGTLDSSIFYVGKKKEMYICYQFENGKLAFSNIHISTSYAKELNTFLASKYTKWNVVIGNAESVWLTKDGKTFIAVVKNTTDEPYYVVSYQKM